GRPEPRRGCGAPSTGIGRPRAGTGCRTADRDPRTGKGAGGAGRSRSGTAVQAPVDGRRRVLTEPERASSVASMLTCPVSTGGRATHVGQQLGGEPNSSLQIEDVLDAHTAADGVSATGEVGGRTGEASGR